MNKKEVFFTPCDECRGSGTAVFYGSVRRYESCTRCGGTGKIKFVGGGHIGRVPCPYCGQADCGTILAGYPLCGPVESGV